MTWRAGYELGAFCLFSTCPVSFSPLLLVLHLDFVFTWNWSHPKSWTLTFLSHHNLFFFLTNCSLSPGKSALSLYLKPHNSFLFLQSLSQPLGFPGGLVVKNSPANARNVGFDPWIRKILWKGKWQPEYSCLGNPMDRGAWWAAIHGIAELDTA